MLRYKADIRTLIYMAATTAVFFYLWNGLGTAGYLMPFFYALYLFLSVSVMVIAHNHNHLPIWRSNVMNGFTDYWLTIFYGFPSFAWIPTHNINHHTLNNREGDYTKTYRFTENNTLLMLLAYPTVSSYYQQKPIREYLRGLKTTDKKRYYYSFFQYVILAIWIGGGLILDWKKTLFFIIIPQQFGMFAVLVFNYIQHVHADEESEWNHSRNFKGLLNAFIMGGIAVGGRRFGVRVDYFRAHETFGGACNHRAHSPVIFSG